ncbi:MAG: SPOR domain-containing protein [Nitrospinota bacterium]|nr:SPOR domain-containing protein [Nitrospinota bacterium]
MSAKLFNEPQKSERHQNKKTIKRIDDLIFDAEKEARDEIAKKIRSNNTRTLFLMLVAVGLFYVLYTGVQNGSLPLPAFLEENSQVAQTPQVIPGPTPKPIPFPVDQQAPEAEADSEDDAIEDSAAEDSPSKDLSPLENEVISMLQKNREEAKGSSTIPASPKTTINSPIKSSRPEAERSSPFMTGIQQSPEQTATLEPVSAPAIPEANARELTAEQSAFFIQVGAFSVKANADRVIKKLMTGGFSPLVQTRTTRSSMHVVFIGGFADEESPQNMMVELKNKGLNPQLKKNDNGSYSIVLSKEKSRDRAEAFKQKMAQNGIFTSVKQMNIDSRLFIVRVGGFDTNNQAIQNQERIEQMGYKGTVIRKKS